MKINWRVESIRLEDAWFEAPHIEVKMDGLITAPMFFGEQNIVEEIELRLNSDGSKSKKPIIKNVIFNDPATIILWSDNTKTVVKCQNGEPYDAEKGFVMAYMKKLLGNDNTFNKEIKKWVKYEPKVEDPNKPLTIGELRQMDGKEVWLSSLDRNCEENFTDRYCGWRKVNVTRNLLIHKDGSTYRITDNGIAYGFKAYREPPKGVK